VKELYNISAAVMAQYVDSIFISRLLSLQAKISIVAIAYVDVYHEQFVHRHGFATAIIIIIIIVNVDV